MSNSFHGIIFQVYQHNSYPSTPDQDNKYHRRRAGGHRIANHLRSLDWDVEVVDFAAEFTYEELKEISLQRVSNKTKFIAFSCIFQSWPLNIDHFLNWFKSKWPNVVTIWGGGTYPNVNSKNIDYHITGYGESAIVHLLKFVTGNGSKHKLQFDLKHIGKKVISANVTDKSFPQPKMSIDFEDRDFILPEEWGHIELSRGCIFKCKFCYYPVLGVQGDYTQDVEDFKRSINYNYDKFGIQNYYVVDETFNDSFEKIAKYGDVVERLSFQPFFSGFIRADLLLNRPEDRIHLARMNFGGHYYGIESFNHQSAKTIGKGIDSQKLKEGLIEIKEYFLKTNNRRYRGTISMIAGLPYETLQTINQSLTWLKQNWSDQHHVWFSLSIPDQNDISHGLDNSMSDFGRDYTKYGYRRSNKLYKPTLVNWENDFLNYEQVDRLVNEFIPKKFPCNNPGNLTLDDYIYEGRTLDKGFATPYTQGERNKVEQFRRKIISTYKLKKLNI